MSLITAHVPDQARRAWAEDLEQLRFPQGPAPYEALIEPARRAAGRHLPGELRQLLRATASEDGPPAALLRGLPLDPRLPAPPADGIRPRDKATCVSEAALLGTLAASGLNPFAYRQERQGRLVHEVCPVAGMETSKTSASRAELGYHTDAAILGREYRPEALALLCLVNADTETLVAPLADALDRLDPAHVAALRRPAFTLRLPEAFSQGGAVYSRPLALVYDGPTGVPEVRAALYHVRTEDPVAAEALRALESVLEEVREAVVLRPGELLLFNNNRTLHARRDIHGDRWLQRAYVRRDLSALRGGGSPGAVVFDSTPFVA